MLDYGVLSWVFSLERLRDPWLWCSKSPGGRKFEPWLGHSTTGKLFVNLVNGHRDSTDSKMWGWGRGGEMGSTFHMLCSEKPLHLHFA